MRWLSHARYRGFTLTEVTASKGSLTIVGLGIKYMSHLTAETRTWIESADQVYYVAVEPFSADLIGELNAASTPFPNYLKGEPRGKTYQLWTKLLVDDVKQGKHVCAAFYGHPGMYVDTSYQALEQLRNEGYTVRMLPAISAESCLFADFGEDLSAEGFCSYEACQILYEERIWDLTTNLIVWQIGSVGVGDENIHSVDKSALQSLCHLLIERYGEQHQVFIYEAAQFATQKPRIDATTLAELVDFPMSAKSTLVVPRKEHAKRRMQQN